MVIPIRTVSDEQIADAHVIVAVSGDDLVPIRELYNSSSDTPNLLEIRVDSPLRDELDRLQHRVSSVKHALEARQHAGHQ